MKETITINVDSLVFLNYEKTKQKKYCYSLILRLNKPILENLHQKGLHCVSVISTTKAYSALHSA